MSPEEVLAFLSALPARTAKLATTRADGRPHVAPVWYDLDGSTMVFNTGADTIKGRNLRRDGRVAICVDDEVPPFTFVTVQGTAELSEDPTSC
jgi:PPOX class probable F420-dependent enzyme